MNNAEDLNTANLQIGPETFPGVFWEFHKTINFYSLKNTWNQAIPMPKGSASQTTSSSTAHEELAQDLFFSYPEMQVQNVELTTV